MYEWSPSVAQVRNWSSVSSSFVPNSGLVSEAGEVPQELGDVLTLVARQVETELAVDDGIARSPGEDLGVRGAAGQQGGRNARDDDDERNHGDRDGPPDAARPTLRRRRDRR